MIDHIPEHLLSGKENCPNCGGIGFIKKDCIFTSDVDFGKVFVCYCNKQFIANPSSFAPEFIRRDLWNRPSSKDYSV
jgi:hypothetical protein